MLRKHVKVTFPSSEERSKEILDLVHSDVCKLMTTASILGSIYYISFTIISLTRHGSTS
jgi:hypothetical protein